MYKEQGDRAAACCAASLVLCVALSMWSVTGRAEALDLLEPVSEYSMSPTDATLIFEDGEDATEADSDTWHRVQNILPGTLLRERVVEFHVFSDGEGETLAYVAQLEHDPDHWIFAVDYVDAVNADEGEWVSTLVHEYAHLLTLGSDQLDAFAEHCDVGFDVDEGCARPASWLQAWYNRFWQGERHALHHKQVGDALENLEGLAVFYANHFDAFVNEYAATNPVEDFAESFAYFVLMPTLESAETEREAKVRFFQAYPELVAEREAIRARTSVRRSAIDAPAEPGAS